MDAPKDIWVQFLESGIAADMAWRTADKGRVRYVRADIAEALATENARLWRAVNGAVECADQYNDSIGHLLLSPTILQDLRAALNETAPPEDEAAPDDGG